MAFVDSLLAENEHLRADIGRIDADYCRQLANLRSANDGANESLRNRSEDVRALETELVTERDLNARLTGEISRLRDNGGTDETSAAGDVAPDAYSAMKTENGRRLTAESERTRFRLNDVLTSTRNTRVKLRNVMACLKREKRQVDDVLRKLRSYLPTLAKVFSSLKDERLATSRATGGVVVRSERVCETERSRNETAYVLLNGEKKRAAAASDALSELEDCLPTIANVFAALRTKNDELLTEHANRTDELRNVLAAERRTSAALRDEVTYLRNEMNRTDERWKSVVKKRVAESKRETRKMNGTELSRLTKAINKAGKRSNFDHTRGGGGGGLAAGFYLPHDYRRRVEFVWLSRKIVDAVPLIIRPYSSYNTFGP